MPTPPIIIEYILGLEEKERKKERKVAWIDTIQNERRRKKEEKDKYGKKRRNNEINQCASVREGHSA